MFPLLDRFDMRRRFFVKKLDDGRAMVNLGCGTRINKEWSNLDFSPYARLVHHKAIAKVMKCVHLLSEERYNTLLDVDPEIIFWDLCKGIPFESNVFDVVYSSHFLEHIDRDLAPFILRECYRVLKTNGTIRLVLPDLAAIVDRYASSLSRLQNGNELALGDHLKALEDLFEQMVRQELIGAAKQPPLSRLLERLVRGNASESGESHRWMYDEYSLQSLMSGTGFRDIRKVDPSSSRIDGWNHFGLDINEDGSIYKKGSLYMEAAK